MRVLVLRLVLLVTLVYAPAPLPRPHRYEVGQLVWVTYPPGWQARGPYHCRVIKQVTARDGSRDYMVTPLPDEDSQWYAQESYLSKHYKAIKPGRK